MKSIHSRICVLHTGTILALMILVLGLSTSCNNPQAPSGPFAEVEASMKTYVDEGQLPCVANLTVKDGELVHSFTYGMANIEEGRELGEDAIYRIYSMSKPITAAALMTLYDEGRFELDDPVAKYIPAFANTRVWEGGKEVEQVEPFTVRHLLTHTAGFSYGWGKSYVDSLYRSAFPKSMWASSSLGEMMEVIAAIPLNHQPGTTYAYSISIDVAGYLAEVLSGMSFDEFLDSRLFIPLGMDDTGFEVAEKDHGRVAMIYTHQEEGAVLSPMAWDTEKVLKPVSLHSGGGGLVSTVADLRSFGQMLLNGGELNGTRVLDEATVKLIMSDQMPEAVPFDGGYGLGGSVDLENGQYGWGGAASTSFSVFPREQLIILGLTQYKPYRDDYSKEYQKRVLETLKGIETE